METEPFEFRSFTLKRALLKIGGQQVIVLRIIFDPYVVGNRINGAAVFIPPNATDNWAELSKAELAHKVVITQEPNNAYLLQRKQPAAIAFVSAADFERLQKLQGNDAVIRINGKAVRVKSANVVASLGSKNVHQSVVIISAHLDSVRNAGADDNASGIGALLEIARYYRNLETQLPFLLKLVALGAEEAGMLGAKAYLNKHLVELQDCALVFNMDSIGGDQEMRVEMSDGVQGIAGKAVNQIPQDLMDKALVDVDARWMFIPSTSTPASNVPEWLQGLITSAAKEIKANFRPGRDMGSDHAVFAQAGIVATDVAISGGRLHTPDDTPEHVVPASLERAAQLVVRVVNGIPPSE